MPTQWRTIAPIVGRTAAQCLERYEHLLDEAQRKAEGLDDEATEAKRLKPGEIDPTPETKPARPDPIDMDDDVCACGDFSSPFADYIEFCRYHSKKPSLLAIADHEKPRRMEVENELRKQDREKLKRKKPEDEPESVFKTKEKKRSKLILPAPQISDREMEQIIKIGHASDSVRLYADGGATR
ncbi:hypothetical protein TELCIR_11336 [Teladorsagia circumcincta]|uniref:HTH myb-type domain-containing protein n=1 Tax=Teladorsagia circumcincta TaxID=45464 RepID=A0A2G9U9P7_TELCI|nr:hypothetical protein TELCIR_11336 [Teladorsagia circumcincta]